MHIPTYIALMLSAAVYGVVKLCFLWNSNWFLFYVGIFVVAISVIGGLSQLAYEDSFEWTWMLWYSIPLSLIAAGQLVGINEMRNAQLLLLNIPPIPSDIPGSGADYERAVVSHMTSMVFPFFARLFAGGVGLFLSRKNEIPAR